MLAHSISLRATTASLLKTTSPSSRHFLHSRNIPSPPPLPTPFVPDTITFLTLIGRQLSQHASKINSWSDLFNLTSPQLRDLGIEPPRNRKYLLRWREKFRRGDWGIGGDLKHVKHGAAKLRSCDLPVVSVDGDVEEAPATMTKSSGQRRLVLNLSEEEEAEMDAEELAGKLRASLLRPISKVQLKGPNQIYGPHVELVKGTHGAEAVLRVQEGLWEHKRGHKIDGGERRKAEVRSKRRAAERKAGRA